MRVTVYLTSGQLAFEHFDADTALDLREEFDEARTLTFDMDGDTVVVVNRDHVVYIDFNHEETF